MGIDMAQPGAGTRNGGDLVVETLQALGANTVFGIPGQHALGLFDAMGRGELHFVSSRIENNSAFAADGFSRATGQVGVLFLSTGPGALTALSGLQEALATGVPMVVVASQIPTAGLGAKHRGMLHQLDEQSISASQVSKSQTTIQQADAIPSALRDAWALATTAPMGPVWVEVPQDILLAPVSVPPVQDVQASPIPQPARGELIAEAARLLHTAQRPLIIAGGGVRRGNAEAALLELAHSLDALVICTPGGKGAYPWDDSLSLQSWIEDVHMSELIEDADVVLSIGTALGEVTSNYFTLAPRGQLIQIDAEPRVLSANHQALGIHADAGLAVGALLTQVQTLGPGQERSWQGTTPVQRGSQARAAVAQRLADQDLSHELTFMEAIRNAVPDQMQTFWDMTISAYWGWSCWDARDGQFHSAQGAGGIGWAYGAAIGASLGLESAGEPGRVLAVSGDGSSMYSISELATARQHNARVTWLIVDDGGYGILREYMEDSFGKATATELSRPDFVALARSFNVPAVEVSAQDVGDALKRALSEDGPNVVVVRTRLKMFAPTHLERASTLPAR